MAEVFYFHVQEDRSIKYKLLEPIMQEDKDVATWRFRIPKVLNNIDMSAWSWWFVYVNAKGQEFSELLTLTDDIDEPDSYSTADYDIDYGISKFPGSFSFALEAISTEQGGEISGEWHTKTYKHKVDSTLQGNQAEYAETESDVISALMQEVRNKVNQLVGGATPLPVNLKSLMTDHDKVYLYTGSETGESTGYWYYWNGTQFVPGGQYGAGIQIDSTLSQSGQAADAKAVGDDLRFIKQNAHFKKVVISTVESGYYSTVNGSKQNNSASTHYNRTPYLIPVDELSLYVVNMYTQAACFDVSGAYISSVMLYPIDAVNKKNILPAGTAFIGLHATNATEFILEKIDGQDFINAEYPYSDDSYIHLEKCWINGEGNIRTTENLDMLIVPNVSAGERFYISNDSTYNCMCFDAGGTLLTASYEVRYPMGRIYTIPDSAVIMYVNLYRTRTKGVNSEMADYLVRINNKKVLAIGDSLTWLDGRANYGGMAYFSGWQRQLRLAGFDVISAGWSGYPYATGLDVVDGVSYSIYKQIVTDSYDVSGYDFVIMFGGTNDVLYDGALGDRPTNYLNRAFDSSKFNGAVGAIINHIRTNNPTAKIILATFPKSEAVSRTFTNAKSRVDELVYNAEFWSCYCKDIFREMNIQPSYEQFDQFFYDSTHPNFDGMQIIGRLMLKAIESYS